MNYMQIHAIIPYYDAYGQNSTCILFQDGSKEYEACSIKNYINRLFYNLHLDPRAVRFWTSQVISTKLNTPLIITEDFILIPIKFRKSIGKQDGCFGYATYQAIESVNNYELHFKNGTSLSMLSPKTYVQKKQVDAKLLSYAYLEYKKRYEAMWHTP